MLSRRSIAASVRVMNLARMVSRLSIRSSTASVRCVSVATSCVRSLPKDRAGRNRASWLAHRIGPRRDRPSRAARAHAAGSRLLFHHDRTDRGISQRRRRHRVTHLRGAHVDHGLSARRHSLSEESPRHDGQRGREYCKAAVEHLTGPAHAGSDDAPRTIRSRWPLAASAVARGQVLFGANARDPWMRHPPREDDRSLVVEPQTSQVGPHAGRPALPGCRLAVAPG